MLQLSYFLDFIPGHVFQVNIKNLLNCWGSVQMWVEALICKPWTWRGAKAKMSKKSTGGMSWRLSFLPVIVTSQIQMQLQTFVALFPLFRYIPTHCELSNKAQMSWKWSLKGRFYRGACRSWRYDASPRRKVRFLAQRRIAMSAGCSVL